MTLKIERDIISTTTITLSEYLKTITQLNQYIDDRDGRLVMEYTQESLETNNPEAIQTLLEMASTTEDQGHPNISTQIRRYLTLGHLRYLLDYQASQTEVENFIFNSPYQSDTFQPITHIPTLIVDVLGYKFPNITLNIIEQIKASHPSTYIKLITTTLNNLPPQHIEKLAQEAVEFLIDPRFTQEQSEITYLNENKGALALSLLKHQSQHPHFTQLALDLADSISHPYTNFYTKLDLIQYFINHRLEPTTTNQLLQDCLNASLDLQHTHFSDLFATAIKLIPADQVTAWLKILNNTQPVPPVILSLKDSEIDSIRKTLSLKEMGLLIDQLVSYPKTTGNL